VVVISRYCSFVGSRGDGVLRVWKMFQKVGKLRFSTSQRCFVLPSGTASPPLCQEYSVVFYQIPKRVTMDKQEGKRSQSREEEDIPSDLP